MKNTKLIRCLAAMALAITISVGKAEAGSYNLPAGSFEVNVHNSGNCNNPNGFPVVTILRISGQEILAGFLLDGSEGSSIWLKYLQDRISSNRPVKFYFDDNPAHSFCGNWYDEGQGTTTAAYKITTLFIYP